jgi:hypothetical protein
LKTSNGTYPGVQVTSQEPDSGVVAIIAIAILTIAITVAALVRSDKFTTDNIRIAIHFLYFQGLYFLIRRFAHNRNLTSMNFDNPVYRKTTEDQFSLEKNLQNRIYPSTVGEEVRALTKECAVSIR